MFSNMAEKTVALALRAYELSIDSGRIYDKNTIAEMLNIELEKMDSCIDFGKYIYNFNDSDTNIISQTIIAYPGDDGILISVEKFTDIDPDVDSLEKIKALGEYAASKKLINNIRFNKYYNGISRLLHYIFFEKGPITMDGYKKYLLQKYFYVEKPLYNEYEDICKLDRNICHAIQDSYSQMKYINSFSLAKAYFMYKDDSYSLYDIAQYLNTDVITTHCCINIIEEKCKSEDNGKIDNHDIIKILLGEYISNNLNRLGIYTINDVVSKCTKDQFKFLCKLICDKDNAYDIHKYSLKKGLSYIYNNPNRKRIKLESILKYMAN